MKQRRSRDPDIVTRPIRRWKRLLFIILILVVFYNFALCFIAMVLLFPFLPVGKWHSGYSQADIEVFCATDLR